VLIADDHAIVRQGLRALIEEQPQWEVVAEATDGRDAVAKVSQLKPDVAILDISMPLLNGLDATRQIAKSYPQVSILILTIHDSDQLIEKILNAGARGYILKADAAHDLVLAIQALLSKKTFFTQKVAQTLLDGFAGKRSSTSEGISVQLTAREREIVQLLAEGKSTKEIANILNLSVKTAETHRTNAMRKLSCHSVTEVVRYAIRNNLTEA
jgi:DNA-binding NarL/FixJ family response regulator